MPKLSIVVKVAIACAVPLLACSTYYTLDRLENASPLLYLCASLALPVLLIGIVGTLTLLTSDKKKGVLLWAAGLAVLAPAALLIYIWR